MVLNRSSFHEKQEKNTVQLLIQILEILRKFENNYDKQLNFSRFGQYLKLSQSELQDILQLILEFQEIYINTFKNYSLKKKITDAQIYLITEKNQLLNIIPRKIRMSKNHLNAFNDIIYFFKHVNRGKGFDLHQNGTDLIKRVEDLCDYYPYLFQEQKNGLIYPSEFGLRFGEILLSYKKSNKNIEKFELEGTKIEVDFHE
jgi:hypothetical protein